MSKYVKKGTHPKYKTAQIKHDYFKIITPAKMVIIGFLAADGCIHLKKSKLKTYEYLCLNLCVKDKIALDLINLEIANGQRHISPNKKTNSLQLYIPSKIICEDLSKWNIVPRKTQIFMMPEISDELMPYFLRGYFYGDGCVSGVGSSRVYMFIGTTKFCNQVSEYLIEKRIVDSCHIYAAKNSHYSNLVIKGRNGAMFSKYIFSDDVMMLLPRKHIITEEQIVGTRWTKNECEKLLKSKDLKTFCEETGRKLNSSKVKLASICQGLATPHLEPM